MALANNYWDLGIVKSATPQYERGNFWITLCEFTGAAFVMDVCPDLKINAPKRGKKAVPNVLQEKQIMGMMHRIKG
jgi:hypothetical protein